MKVEKFLLVLSIFLLANCAKKKPHFYYPTSEKFENLKDKDSFYLKEFSSYKSIIDTLWYYNKNIRNPVFIIENAENKYFFKPVELPFGCYPELIRFKNFIVIYKDSISHTDTSYPKDSLKYILKKNLLNFGLDKEYANSPDKLIIRFSKPKEVSVPYITSNLISIFNTYNEINEASLDSLELNIDFREFIHKPPPPLPLSVSLENNN